MRLQNKWFCLLHFLSNFIYNLNMRELFICDLHAGPLNQQGSSLTSSTLYTRLETSSASKRVPHITSTPSFTPTRTVTVSSFVPAAQDTPSFKQTQSVRVSTTPIFKGSAAISVIDKLSFIASVSSPTRSVKPTGSVVVISTISSDGEQKFSSLQGNGQSILLMSHASTPRSTNTTIMFNLGHSVGSIGTNHTLMSGNHSTTLEKVKIFIQYI